MDLSVCLVATELFGWGRYGGIGMCTRSIGTALVERGVRTTVVVPRGRGQRPVEELDGMVVYGFRLLGYPSTGSLYELCDADVYHSEGVNWGTGIASGRMPSRRHVVTCQNPRTREDWRTVGRYYPWRRKLFNLLYGPKLVGVMRGMDGVYCQARYVIPKVRTIYGLDVDPGFLPNPVVVPQEIVRKADEPTVCFLGRFDAEKQPELFFELAGRFPSVRFVAMGGAHDRGRDVLLRRRYGSIPNLEMPGFVDGAEKGRVLGESWVLVNTSVSECLPISFLEAAAHGCAILSFHDPDGFASKFGCHVGVGGLDRGLGLLMEGERWRARGEAGREYVRRVHERGRVVDAHLEVYRRLLEG